MSSTPSPVTSPMAATVRSPQVKGGGAGSRRAGAGPEKVPGGGGDVTHPVAGAVSYARHGQVAVGEGRGAGQPASGYRSDRPHQRPPRSTQQGSGSTGQFPNGRVGPPV